MRRIISPREAYRYWAESFDQGTPILALESRALTPLLPDVTGKRFLDIGCGTGRWLRWAAQRGAEVAGADLSLEMLRKAATLAVVQADATALPFLDDSADIVLSALTIGHIRPISAVLDELARVAKPGASVIVTDFHPDALKRGWKRTFKHEGDTIELESDYYNTDELRHRALTLERFLELPFGDEERHFFDAASKGPWFDENRTQPAILIAIFRKHP
jgi:ubiquinone/menaquinone biosynthesis C-methylase UbiE